MKGNAGHWREVAHAVDTSPPQELQLWLPLWLLLGPLFWGLLVVVHVGLQASIIL